MLDAHAAIRGREGAGIAPAHAEAIIGAVAQAAAEDRAHLATRADIAGLEVKIAALEVRLVKWGVGIGAALAGLLFTALRLTA